MARASNKISVVAKRGSFWRCGKSFTDAPRVLTVVSDSDFKKLAETDRRDVVSESEEQRLREEPALVVVRAEEEPAKPAA